LEEDLAEVGLVAGVEVLAEAGEEVGLAGVIPMLGDGLGMVCLMVTLTEDMDLLTQAMVMVWDSPMAIIRGRSV
jgi:hypothetical protein